LATPPPPVSKAPLIPAGGLVSTADDLVRWTAALHAGKLLAPASYAKLCAATKLASGEVVPYGFGTRLRSVDGHALVVANGDGPGQHSELAFDGETIAIALYNFGPRYAYVSRRLLAIARGAPIVEPPAIPVTGLAKLAGAYAGGDRAPITVELERGALYLRRQGATTRDALIAIAPATFRVAGDDTRYRFVAAGDKITGVRVSTDGSPGDTLQARAVAGKLSVAPPPTSKQ
jgi:D-alanyl-D-alanine carboxypeptidase